MNNVVRTLLLAVYMISFFENRFSFIRMGYTNLKARKQVYRYAHTEFRKITHLLIYEQIQVT